MQKELARKVICPDCKNRFDSADFHYLGHMDNQVMFNVRCRNCTSRGFISATYIKGEMETSPMSDTMPTNQPPEPIPAGKSESPRVSVPRIQGEPKHISYDDVLDIHEYLARVDHL